MGAIEKLNDYRATAPLAIWPYLDYRAFLKDFYLQKKRARITFSYRLFSQKTGIQSPNYLKLIIDGQRNLTLRHARRIARFCSLDTEQTDYFLALVQWNQCKHEEEKDLHWQQVLKLRKDLPASRLSNSYLSILSGWHAIAIMEMMRVSDFDASPLWIQSRFRGEISIAQIETALKALVDVGLVEQVPTGFKVCNQNLKTEDDIPSACVRSYHRSVIQEGLKALVDTDLDGREFISTTFSIKRTDLPKLKAELRRFRDLTLQMTSETDSPDEVYQLNLQLFPLSKARSKQ